MATAPITAKAPWHLWAVGIVSLLWNAIGAYDYSMTHLQGAQYMADMGMQGDAIAYIEALPAWATGAWALGVWGSFIGSILLLLRSALAVWSFVVSLVGVAAMTIYNLGVEVPASMSSPGMVAFEWVIKIVVVLLLWYSWRMKQRGVLR